jgi:hypothetical protein
MQRLAVEVHDLAGLAGPQVAAGGVEQRRVDRAEPRRRERDERERKQRRPADAYRPVFKGAADRSS